MSEIAAPFGLTWGGKREELQAADVDLDVAQDGPNGAMFMARNLPKPIPDVETVAVFFTDSGKLWRMVAMFKATENDPFGLATQKRYGELKETLSKRYGRPTEVWHVNPTYAAEHFVLGISAGENQVFCDFAGSDPWVQLGIRAGGTSDSFCIIIYESKGLKLEFENERRRRELDAL